jgi:hypothetical protein
MADFEPEDGKRLDDGTSWREVYAADLSDLDGLGGEYVVKTPRDNKKGMRDGTALTQNKREVRTHLESTERGQDFVPDVVGFSQNYDVVVAERVSPYPEPDLGSQLKRTPGRQAEMENYDSVQESLIPEGWSYGDRPEIGYKDGTPVLIDSGRIERSDWMVDDPTAHGCVEAHAVDGETYFTVEG